MNATKQFFLIFLVLISCVGCDQATKSIAKSVLPEAEPLSYLGDTVRLQLVYNSGVFLRLGASLPETWRHGLYLVGVGGLLLGILAYAALLKRRQPSLVFALALFFAGGVSNLLDRIAYEGYVMDFINVGIGPLRTGIFNIADISIMVGAFVVFITQLRERENGR